MKNYRNTPYYFDEDGNAYRNGRKLKPQISAGYCYITMCIHGIPNRKRLHRILAEIYLDNPNNLPEVNHKNGIKTDCRIVNLEWSDKSHNQQHRVLVLKKGVGQSRSDSKLKDDDVLWIRKNYIKGDTTFGQRPLARKFNLTQKTIASIVKNKHWRHLL